MCFETCFFTFNDIAFSDADPKPFDEFMAKLPVITKKTSSKAKDETCHLSDEDLALLERFPYLAKVFYAQDEKRRTRSGSELSNCRGVRKHRKYR